MNRRSFLFWLGACGVYQMGGRLRPARGAPSEPRAMWIHVQATGGWDQALFCDPKPSVRPGLSAAHKAIRRAGNLSYLAFCDFDQPQGFFGRYYDRLLIINGVDTATNNHDIGTRYSSSGSSNEGTPCFAAQVAAAYGQSLPLAFLAFGGYDETAELIPRARVPVGGSAMLASLTRPNDAGGGEPFLPRGTAALVEKAHIERIQRLLREPRLPGQKQALQRLQQVRLAQKELSRLQIPAGPEDLTKLVRIGLDAYARKLAVSMGLSLEGFDSHAQNETTQADRLKRLFATVSLIADESEARGVPALILMTSDFGRTPYYTNDGTDHWPTSSVMVLVNSHAKRAGLPLPTNQVIGATTDGAMNQALRPVKINPRTFMPDAAGVQLTPGHLMRALRRIAQIDGAEVLRRFPLTVDRDIALG
jgi:hypothetical protein